jgi:hypothetical protein
MITRTLRQHRTGGVRHLPGCMSLSLPRLRPALNRATLPSFVAPLTSAAHGS